MERQKGALLDLDRIKNERLLRFQKLQSLQVGDQNSCKQIRKVKAGICKIQKAHKLEADTNTNKITNTNTIKTLDTNKNSKYKSLPSCATKSSKTGNWQTALSSFSISYLEKRCDSHSQAGSTSNWQHQRKICPSWLVWSTDKIHK